MPITSERLVRGEHHPVDIITPGLLILGPDQSSPAEIKHLDTTNLSPEPECIDQHIPRRYALVHEPEPKIQIVTRRSE